MPSSVAKIVQSPVQCELQSHGAIPSSMERGSGRLILLCMDSILIDWGSAFNLIVVEVP